MLLRHATPRKNLASCLSRGLLCGRSLGRLPVVWLHSPQHTGWALAHTVYRHGGRIESVVVLEVEVPRAWLRRNRRGLWYCVWDIPPSRITSVREFGEVARSPVKAG